MLLEAIAFLSYLSTAIVLAIMALIIFKTRLGMVVRAAVSNAAMVNALGINVPKVYTGVFMFGCWLGGLAGTLMPPMSVVALGSDMAVIIECFIIVVIGGLGSVPGALVGGLALGVIESFGAAYISAIYKDAFAFLVLILFLLVRPQGIFGERGTERV